MAGFSIGPLSVNGLKTSQAIILSVCCLFGYCLLLFCLFCRRRNRERQQPTEAIVIHCGNSEGKTSAGGQAWRLPVMPAYHPQDNEMAEDYDTIHEGQAWRLPVMNELANYARDDEMAEDYDSIQEYVDRTIAETVRSIFG